MSIVIGYATLSATDPAFAAALPLLGANGLQAWLEDDQRADGFRLELALTHAEALARLTHWPQGHLFTPAGHLRWEHLAGGQIHAVLMSAAPLPVAFVGALPLTPVDPPQVLLFWGTRPNQPPEGEQPVWDEGRIPKLDRLIPQPWREGDWQNAYAGLEVQRYVAPLPPDGQRVIVRYLAYRADYTPPDYTPSAGGAQNTEEAP